MSGFQLNATVAKRVDLDIIPISLLKPVLNRNYFALINLLKKNTYLANQISFFYYQQLVGNASLLNNNKESANVRVPWDSMYQDMTGKVLILSPYDQYQLYMWVTVNNTQNMATQSNFQFLLFSLGNYLTQLNTAQRTINQKLNAQHYYPLGVNVKTNQQMKRFLSNWVNIPSSPPSNNPTPVPPTPGPTELVILPFTTVGSFTWIAPSLTTSVEYLVVGGGGGGGGGYDTGAGGGGGAGLILTGTITVTPGTTYAIVVGDGGDGGTGSGSPSPSETSGLNGVTSGFYTILATGGSGGYRSRDQTGGTGVGGEIADANTFTSGGPGRGGGNGASTISAGGGGGNGSAGANSTSAVGGIGGSGISNSITGSSVVYGAGGNGGRENGTEDGDNGTSNTGNGAGGASSTSFSGYNGGKGGSGIVILKYYQ